MGYLSRFLCVGFALALLATGCVGPRLLKGGKGVTTHKPAGVSEQTLVQSENPSQATKQDQETVKGRTYTVPADSRVEQSSAAGAPSGSSQLSTINSQPSPAFLLSTLGHKCGDVLWGAVRQGIIRRGLEFCHQFP